MSVSFIVSTGNHRIRITSNAGNDVENVAEYGPNTSVSVGVNQSCAVLIEEIEYVPPTAQLAQDYQDKYGSEK